MVASDSSPDAYDFIVIGSGFGGSVSALRLVEKGYRVLLLEKGLEWRAEDFPKTNWELSRWLWFPLLGMRGFFQMTFFRHLTVLSGVGLGGGSLVYGNTLPEPPPAFFENPRWAGLADWKRELMPHYATVRRMLGATKTPYAGAADALLRDVAGARGHAERFEETVTGVYYGEPGKAVPDPYFSGEGPPRRGCIACGACMTGCRHEAKNTLDKNYLWLARKRGLEVKTSTEVEHLAAARDGGYVVRCRAGGTARLSRGARAVYRAKNVVVAAGVLGTLELLLRMKADPNGLPELSRELGATLRTNSESLIGVTSTEKDADFSKGVAIASIYQVDERSHVEMVRYGAGSGALRLMALPHVAGNVPGPVKVVQAWSWFVTHPLRALKVLFVKDWAKSTMILLYMRAAEGTLRFVASPVRRGLGLGPGLATELETGAAPTASIADASAVASELAARSGGVPVSMFTETLLGIPTTAHVLGGCCMGSSAEEGVIDRDHRVFGYPGLYVVDGSAISANPGVNPSLTIAALAERAMSKIPSKIPEKGAAESNAR